MAISPVNPPGTLSSQRLVNIMEADQNPSNTPNWNDGWGYPPNRYGASLSVGARLKHRTNLYNECNVSPYQDMLATIYIKWLTVSFQFPRSDAHNVAIEMVPNPTWGRIRPDLNGGKKEWVQLNYPTGGVAAGLISTGATVGAPPSGNVLNGGRIMKLPHNYILHPWAKVVSPGNEVDAYIESIVSQNPSDDFADSKLDCICCDWWVRLVPFDENQGFNHDFNSNPVILVSAADPYVGRPRVGLINDNQCVAAVGASSIVVLNDQWTQVGYFTSTNAPDMDNTLPYAGISNVEFLSAPPPGYDQNVAPPPTPEPPVVAPSVGRWFTKLSGGLNAWTSKSSTPAAPTSLDNDESGDEMLLQQSAGTAAKRTIVFRAVDATDGFTAETGLSWGAGDIKISKNGGAESNHAGTVTEIGAGMYKYEFTVGELDTAGVLSFRTNKSGVRPTAFLHQVVAFDPANLNSLGLQYLDAAVTSRLAGSIYEGTDAMLDKASTVETGVSLRAALRLILAVLGGKVSGAGTGTEVFRNAVADTKNRVTATVDTSGNRTSITTDLT